MDISCNFGKTLLSIAKKGGRGRAAGRCGAAGTFGIPCWRRPAYKISTFAGVKAVWRPDKHRVTVSMKKVVMAWRTAKAAKTRKGARALDRAARPEYPKHENTLDNEVSNN